MFLDHVFSYFLFLKIIFFLFLKSNPARDRKSDAVSVENNTQKGRKIMHIAL